MNHRPLVIYGALNKIIDVRDLPSGTLVSDPTQPLENRACFRLP